MDDPLIIASLLPPRVLMDAQNLRWTLCASDRCFRNPVFSSFFRSVKVLPLARGDGIYQKVFLLSMSSVSQDIALSFDAVRNTCWTTFIVLFEARGIIIGVFFFVSFLHFHRYVRQQGSYCLRLELIFPHLCVCVCMHIYHV